MQSAHATGLLVHLLFTGLSVYVVAKVLPGIRAKSLASSLWFACIVAIVNAAFWALFWPIALPFKLLTLGIGSFFINGLVFLVAGRIAGGVEVSGCLTGAIAAVAVTFLNGVLQHLVFGR
jgi:putative membrane protein